MLEKEEHEHNAILFIIGLIAIELCWILGTKVSEWLLDYIVELSFQEIQVAESVFNYTIALTIFFWGYIVDRYNHKRKIILFFSSSFWIFGNFILFFGIITPAIFLSVQILWGLSFGASGPLVASYLGDLSKVENRGKLFSIFTIFIYIIKGSNIAVNGLIGQAMGDWRVPTFLFAVIGIGVLIIFNFLKEPEIASNEPEFISQKSKNYDYKLELNDLKVILSNKTNILFLIQGIFGMIGVSIVTRYMNYWFTSSQYDGFGMNAVMAIILLGIGGSLGGLIGILIVGRWIDSQFEKGKIERSLLFAIICIFGQGVLYSVLILVLNYPDSLDGTILDPVLFFNLYPVFFSFMLIFNLCIFCGTPVGTTVSVARTHLNFPEHRGTAAALYDLTDFIGVGIGLGVGTLFLMITSSFRLTVMLGSLFWIGSGIIWIVAMKFIKQDYENVRTILKKRAEIKF